MMEYRNVDDIIMYGGGGGGKGDKGDQGDKGDDGDDGDKGDKGETGATGPAGSDGTDTSNDTAIRGNTSLIATVSARVTEENTLIRKRISDLETAPNAPFFYQSPEIILSDYTDGNMLVIWHPAPYDPLRIVMKARDKQTGYRYTVQPGNDYGFNYKHGIDYNLNQALSIEIAIGNAGLFVMTNDGSARNILTGQRRDRFNIYAVLEFAPVTYMPDMPMVQQAPTNDGSLDF